MRKRPRSNIHVRIPKTVCDDLVQKCNQEGMSKSQCLRILIDGFLNGEIVINDQTVLEIPLSSVTMSDLHIASSARSVARLSKICASKGYRKSQIIRILIDRYVCGDIVVRTNKPEIIVGDAL